MKSEVFDREEERRPRYMQGLTLLQGDVTVFPPTRRSDLCGGRPVRGVPIAIRTREGVCLPPHPQISRVVTGFDPYAVNQACVSLRLA
jgi:hypothetical protein